MRAPPDVQAVTASLRTLLALGLGTFELLETLAADLSRCGLRRHEIVTLFFAVMAHPPQGLSEAQLDLVGDVNAHLVGQCAVADLIRLVGDPEDLDALAHHVSAEMAGWHPPP